MKEIIAASILFFISIGTFVISIRSFQEKGFLFNNAYIYASKKEQENMDKTPHYRQSAIVFLLISIIFLLNGLATLFASKRFSLMAMAVAVTAIIYAIVSSIAIEKQKR